MELRFWDRDGHAQGLVDKLREKVGSRKFLKGLHSIKAPFYDPTEFYDPDRLLLMDNPREITISADNPLIPYAHLVSVTNQILEKELGDKDHKLCFRDKQQRGHAIYLVNKQGVWAFVADCNSLDLELFFQRLKEEYITLKYTKDSA